MANKLFNSISLFKPKRNFFDLTHDVKLSCDMGKLIPTLCFECVPGDSFNLGCESLVRFQPLVSPVMHRFDVYHHYFFVPYRILWPNWEKYLTSLTSSETPPSFPTVIHGSATSDVGTLYDYLGLPPLTAVDWAVNAMPIAAYRKIFNEFYRGQDFMEKVVDTLDDGDNTTELNVGLPATDLLYRAWEHDYFTSALPFAQKGPAVDIPFAFGDTRLNANADPGVVGATGTIDVDNSITGPGLGTYENEVSSDPTMPGGQFYIDGDNLQGTSTITDLRRAYALQRWLELAARGGTRLTELIRNFFGVTPDDARLQRPEYITGTKSPISISEVLNTTGELDGLPQGNMAGHGVGVTGGKYGNYFVKEHGLIMSIMSVMPKPAYMQGIHRMWRRVNDPTEQYWPQFAHIGEQEILGHEIYADDATFGQEVWGYIPRYAEFKYMPSRVCGQFRSSLDYWHEARKFATPPELNIEFISCNPDKRIFAVEDPEVHSLLCHVLHKISSKRPLPKFGSPI